MVSGSDRAGQPGQLNLPLDPRWGELLGFVGIFALGGLVVIVDSRAAGVVMAVLAVAFTYLGLVSIPVPILGLAAAAALFWAAGRTLA
jgi:hypothetical protein